VLNQCWTAPANQDHLDAIMALSGVDETSKHTSGSLQAPILESDPLAHNLKPWQQD